VYASFVLQLVYRVTAAAKVRAITMVSYTAECRSNTLAISLEAGDL
jgi:hypothetical protein